MTARTVRLGDVCTPERTSVLPGRRADLRYIGLETIEAGTGRLVEGALSKTPETPQANSFQFDSGHVLYGKLRPYLNKVAIPDFEGKCSTEIVPLRPTGALDRRYLGYFLRSGDTVARISERTAGSRMPRADMDFVLGMALALPPLDEQQRAVDLLGRAESIVQLRREACSKASGVISALFIDMFGDPAANEKAWPLATFGDVGELDRGRSRHRPRDAAHLYGGPYPFIQTGDVANSGGIVTRWSSTYSEYGVAQSRLWPKGTLCITIAANIAKTGVLTFDACFPDSVVGFTPGKSVTTAYIQAWLGFLQPLLEASAPQAAQKNINLDILRNLPIALPPMALQRRFQEHRDAIASLTAQQESASRVSVATFRSMLSQAFPAQRPSINTTQ